MENSLFSGSFDPNENKITFNYNGFIALGETVVSIKDSESNTCIYSFDFRFDPKTGGWCIPVPKESFDFWNSPNFTTFKIDIYKNRSEDSPIYSFDIPIRRKIFKKSLPNNRFLNFDPIFFNHNQFFVDGIYNGFFSGSRINSVIDLGANIGLFTEWVLDRFGSDTSVIAVEPNGKAIGAFKHIHSNKPNVRLFECLITDNSGDEIELLVNPENSLISSIEGTGDSYSDKMTVKSMSLPDLMRDNNLEHVDLLKMDVEGAEYMIFKAMDSEFLKRFGHLLIEFHLNDGNKILDIVNKIKEAGFSIDIREDDTRYVTDTNSERGTIFAKRN